jgi:hypothetical protein
MNLAPARVRIFEDCHPGAPPIEALVEGNRPTLLRGLARDWALVSAGLESPKSAMDYLRGCDNGKAVQYTYGAPDVAGRPFYDATFAALNCEVRRGSLDCLLTEIATHLHDPQPPTYYMASLLVDSVLPGFRAANDLNLAIQGVDAPPRIWVGNRVVASCHYDAPSNIACCAVGRRRVTLLPPRQIGNLYPGPMDPTPGGQAVSMVDFADPDFDRFPRFRDALVHAEVAVLEPGDAIFIPSMWWHHVEALEGFNVLVNYWWGSMPSWIPTPMNALYHALWAIRDRPEHEKRAWHDVFDYYVFGAADQAGAHLPNAARGLLGTLDEPLARQLRAMLMDKLNR